MKPGNDYSGKEIMGRSASTLLPPGLYQCCSLGIPLDDLRFGIPWLPEITLWNILELPRRNLAHRLLAAGNGDKRSSRQHLQKNCYVKEERWYFCLWTSVNSPYSVRNRKQEGEGKV